MKIEFDPKKSARNEKERSLPFALASDLEWDTAHIEEDTRKPYPELRLVAYAYLRRRMHVCCFTPIAGGIRVISFRKANKREEKLYAKAAANQ